MTMTHTGQFGDGTNLPTKSSVHQHGSAADPASGGDPGSARRFEDAIDELDCQAVLPEHQGPSTGGKSLGVAAHHAPGNGTAAVWQIERDLLSDGMSWVGARGRGHVHAPLQALPAPTRRAVGQRGRDGVGHRRAAFWCPAFWCMGFCLLPHRTAVRGGQRGRDGTAPVGGMSWCMGFCRRSRWSSRRRSRDGDTLWCMDFCLRRRRSGG